MLRKLSPNSPYANWGSYFDIFSKPENTAKKHRGTNSNTHRITSNHPVSIFLIGFLNLKPETRSSKLFRIQQQAQPFVHILPVDYVEKIPNIVGTFILVL